MQSIMVCVAIYFILFFPLSIKLQFIIDLQIKKIYFCVSIFNLTVSGGTILVEKTKIIINFGRKQICFELKDYLSGKKRLGKVSGVSVNSFKSLLILPLKIESIEAAGIINIINNTFCPIVKNKVPYITLNNDLFIVKENYSMAVLEIKAFATVFTFLLIAIKKLSEKVINAINKQKQCSKNN